MLRKTLAATAAMLVICSTGQLRGVGNQIAKVNTTYSSTAVAPPDLGTSNTSLPAVASSPPAGSSLAASANTWPVQNGFDAMKSTSSTFYWSNSGPNGIGGDTWTINKNKGNANHGPVVFQSRIVLWATGHVDAGSSVRGGFGSQVGNGIQQIDWLAQRTANNKWLISKLENGTIVQGPVPRNSISNYVIQGPVGVVLNNGTIVQSSTKIFSHLNAFVGGIPSMYGESRFGL